MTDDIIGVSRVETATGIDGETLEVRVTQRSEVAPRQAPGSLQRQGAQRRQPCQPQAPEEPTLGETAGEVQAQVNELQEPEDQL